MEKQALVVREQQWYQKSASIVIQDAIPTILDMHKS